MQIVLTYEFFRDLSLWTRYEAQNGRFCNA